MVHVEIDYENFSPPFGQSPGDVNRVGSFPNSPLLVADANYPRAPTSQTVLIHDACLRNFTTNSFIRYCDNGITGQDGK
jgi:hypothetical protein